MVLALTLFTGCGRVSAQSGPIKGSSRTVAVTGQYSPLALDTVRTVTMKDGQLVVAGSRESVTLPLPAGADAARPVRHWALTTEANVDGKRLLTFTHDESLDDFTLELQPTEAEMHYGVFAGPQGAEVMVLAWGAGSRCSWGYVTIRRAAGPDR
jgi:hypothetical protein